MFDLQPHELKQLQDRIKRDYDAFSVRTLSEEHRDHLGASVIGHECTRHIWYAFRWVITELFEGRQLRLFETGKREEARFIANLRGIGFKVWDVDAGGNQFRIVGSNGHYGGAADSVGLSPYPELNEPMLLEFKTHNRGSFKLLIKETVTISKPRHYAQMCEYGVKFGLRYALYLAINKDDDDIYPEIVKLDPRHADDLSAKANDIIYAQHPPPKLSLQPEYFECKWCVFQQVCHFNAKVEKNCRSCKYAQPIENAQWGCNYWKRVIPHDFIPQGCELHQGIV